MPSPNGLPKLDPSGARNALTLNPSISLNSSNNENNLNRHNVLAPAESKLLRVRRFLSTLHDFAQEVSPEMGANARKHIMNLAVSFNLLFINNKLF